MTWFRNDDTAPEHPKFVGLDDTAIAMWWRGGCYCARYATDGRIPGAAIVRLTAKKPIAVAARLVAAGLWEVDGLDYVMHDFLDYNPSAAETRAKRESRAIAGRAGGIRSGQARSKPEAIASPVASPMLNPLPVPSRPVHVPIPDPEQRDPGSAGHEPDGSGPSIGSERQAPADERPAPEARTEPAPFSLLPTEAAKPREPTTAERIFAAYLDGWHRVVKGTRAPTLDDKRRRMIAARLRNFTAEDLEAAARGIWLSEFNANAANARSFDLALRDAEHVEKFRDIAANPALGREKAGARSANAPARSSLQPAGSYVPRGPALAADDTNDAWALGPGRPA